MTHYNNLTNLITGHHKDLIQYQQNCIIHKKISSDLLSLSDILKEHNFELKIISGHRSFERQKKIWHQKINHIRPILNKNSQILSKQEIDSLNQEDLLFTILYWSAFPGLSRHHFGTDLDICDNISLKNNPNYKINLTNDEYSSGIFKKFHNFLQSNIENINFFQPYTDNDGAIMPEKWHYSHVYSKQISNKISYNFFIYLLDSQLFADFPLRDIALKNSKKIYNNYFY